MTTEGSVLPVESLDLLKVRVVQLRLEVGVIQLPGLGTGQGRGNDEGVTDLSAVPCTLALGVPRTVVNCKLHNVAREDKERLRAAGLVLLLLRILEPLDFGAKDVLDLKRV